MVVGGSLVSGAGERWGTSLQGFLNSVTVYILLTTGPDLIGRQIHSAVQYKKAAIIS